MQYTNNMHITIDVHVGFCWQHSSTNQINGHQGSGCHHKTLSYNPGMADMQLPSIGSQGNLIWQVFFLLFWLPSQLLASHIVGFIPWPCKERSFVPARLVWGI